MYTYTITERIAGALARIEQLRAQIDSIGPLPRVWLGRTRRDLEAESIAASTIMEGVSVTEDEARRILAGDRPSAVSEADARLVSGYQDAMRYVLARADAVDFHWHSELILAIHHHVLGGSFTAGAGRYRETQNWLTNRATGAQVYLPPPPSEVPALVADATSWLDATDEPGPVAAALAHVALAGIHPFRDGNGRTARIAASLAMYRAGFRLPQFTSLEEWWGRHVNEYYGAFDCLGERWSPEADVTPFVEAHVAAQASQVEALALRNRLEHALWTVLEDIVVHDLSLPERVTNALYDAFFAREVTNRYYRNVGDVTGVTASHDLAKLVASGMLSSRGAGRSAHYVATAGLYASVVRAASLDAQWITHADDNLASRDAVLAALARRLQLPVRGS